MASIYRAGIWFLQGWRNYGKSGYERASKDFDPKALDVNLSDRVAIVTGSNSGLGLETSYELAKRGAKVYMLCRDMKKGSSAIEELKLRDSEIDEKLLILSKVDVSLQCDIKNFVKNLQEDSIDILVNNAGCMLDGRPMTSEGIEVNFATNVIGPYLMTELLIPKLKKSEKGAIVLTVTSGGMLTQKLEPNDILMSKTGKGIDIYAQNKRQQVEITHHWSQKYKDQGIFFCTAHPGWADTPAVRTSMPDFYARFHKEFRTPQQGADTIVWAVVSEVSRRNFPNGSFFEDRKAVSEHLPLSGTKSTDSERSKFIENLEKLIK